MWRRPAARGRPSLVIAPRPDYDTAESRTVYRPGPRGGRAESGTERRVRARPGEIPRGPRRGARERVPDTLGAHDHAHDCRRDSLCHAKLELQAAQAGRYRWGRAIILKSLSSTLDYDRHYTTMHSRWTIGRQAGLRRVPEILTSWPARYGVSPGDGRFGENRERHGDRCECRPLLASRRPSFPIRTPTRVLHMIYQLSRFPRAARLIHGLKCMMHVAAYDLGESDRNHDHRNRVYICINAS